MPLDLSMENIIIFCVEQQILLAVPVHINIDISKPGGQVYLQMKTSQA